MVKKGITPVVSIALLLGITLATVGLLATQVFDVIGDSIDETAAAVSASPDSTGDAVIVRNNADREVQINSVITEGDVIGDCEQNIDPNSAIVCGGAEVSNDFGVTSSVDVSAEFVE